MKQKFGLKKVLGVFAIILGFIALVTPLTPGAFWLLFTGLQLLGVNVLFLDKIEQRLNIIKNKFRRKKKQTPEKKQWFDEEVIKNK